MKLYVKQKVFSWRDKFKVYDQNGSERYYVEGEFLSFGKKLRVYDLQGQEVAFIQQKLWNFLPRFIVSVPGRADVEIIKNFTLFRQKYTLEGIDWEVNGSFWAHDYEITQRGYPVVRIQKEWMTWGDCYELDVSRPHDEILALAVVLVIDCVMAQNDSGGSILELATDIIDIAD